MLMFSACSGPCETCKIHLSDARCMAGHGDDDYVYADPAWIAEREANAKHRHKRGTDSDTKPG